MQHHSEPIWTPPRADLLRLHQVRNSVLARVFDRKPTRLSIWGCELSEVIGRGGMGTVYRAYDATLDRTLAIKLLSLPSVDPHRLLAEAKAMARVSHPNVIRVHDAGLFEGHVFIVMEYIEGCSLRTWLTTPRRREQLLHKLVLAGRGLAAIHRGGLIHRDFKPGNILVGAGGEVKIIDFGIAISDARADESAAGTLAYMSPEQLRGLRLTPQSDQFSFCTTLFEAVTGGHPFTESTAASTVQRILLGELPPTKLPRWLRKTLARGLSKNPELRFPSMEAVVDALERGPVRRRRIFQVTGGLIAASTLALASFSAGEVEDPCIDLREAALKSWGPDSLTALVQQHPSLASSPRWTKFLPRWQGFIDAWVDERVETCSAHQQRELTTASYAAINECLVLRQSQASLLVERVRRSGEVDDKTIQTLEVLPAPARCREATEDASLLANEPLRLRVFAVRKDLHEAKTYLSLGEFELALDITEGAHNRALALAYTPLIAEAKLARGAVSLELQHGDATPLLEEAFQIATTNALPPIAQEAASRLVFAFGEHQRKPNVAQVFGRWATNASSQYPLDQEGQWLLHLNLGVAADRRGDYFEARQQYADAINYSKGHRRAVTLHNLAVLDSAFGFTSSGLKTLLTGLEQLRQDYGKSHSLDFDFLGTLANIHLDRGDMSSTREVIAQMNEDQSDDCHATAIGHAADPHKHLRLCGVKARFLLMQGNPEGLAAATEYIHALASFYPEDSWMVVAHGLLLDQFTSAPSRKFPEIQNTPHEAIDFHHLHALALRNVGNVDAAHEHARAAVEQASTLPDQPKRRLATMLLHQGAIALDRGQLNDARKIIADTSNILDHDANILHAKLDILKGRFAMEEQRPGSAQHHFDRAEAKLLMEFPSGWQEDLVELRRYRNAIE